MKRVSKKIRLDQLKAGQSLCDFCTAKCCRYFALPIDTPETWDDFDDVRWYLAHGQTAVFAEDGQWYLLVKTDCKYLRSDNRCGIYEDRMKICRNYTTDNCEYEDDFTYDKIFEAPEQIWEYAEAILPPRRKRRKKRSVAVIPVSQLVGSIDRDA